MRIGEFSKRNNITQDAIRHYIDLGLLVVEKQGSHYYFTEENCCDLQKIMMLKELDFTLSEIQTILCFNRLEGERSNDFRRFLLSLLERNRARVNQKLQKFNEIEKILKQKIQELTREEEGRSKVMGFPLSSLSVLCCPSCKNQLHIAGGTIENHMLLTADVFCECGYGAIVEDGIFIDRQAVKKRNMPSKQEFLESTSPHYINFMYNGTTTLMDYIHKHARHSEYILELDHCVGRFLMQYIDQIPEGCTYILLSTDLDRLRELKHNLQLQYGEKSFIFLCSELKQIPLASGSIDIIVNHGMNTQYALSEKKFLPAVASPLLKPMGLFAGAFWHLGIRSGTGIHNPMEARDYLCRNEIIKSMEELNFSSLNMEDFGPVKDSSPYLAFKDKEQYLTLYAGIRNSSNEALPRNTAREIWPTQHRIS